MTRGEQLELALKRNRGGKGQGPSHREMQLADALNMSVHWVTPTGKPKPYPRHYTLDVASPFLKIAIEVDGPSHRVLSVKAADRRKTRLLRSYGWHVFRVTNDDVDKRFEETVNRLRKRVSNAT
jgi:hypothetical protein